MKRCPECRRDYYDETLLYCLDDGTELLDGPASADDPATVRMHSPESHRGNTITDADTRLYPGATSREITRSKSWLVPAIGVAAILLGGFAYGIYKFVNGRQPVRTTANMQTQRLTGDGKARVAEISPDGKFLAYVRPAGAEHAIWLKQIQTNSNIPIVRAGELDRFESITFSPDGNFVYFNAVSTLGEPISVYRVPTLGGAPTKVLTKAYQIQFSPDGRQISYGRFDAPSNESGIFVANSDGTNERKIASRSGTKFFNSTPAWSPDGKWIAIAAGDDLIAPDPNLSLTLLPVAGGTEQEVGTKWAHIDDLVWHPTGDSLILAAAEVASTQTQLWEVDYPTGERRRLTNNLNGHNSVSITADGKSIVTGEIYARTALWVSPDLKPENAKQIMPPSGDTWGLSWTPDGRIVYVSDHTGEAEVWITDADGANARPLTNDRVFKFAPVVSADGRFIVYAAATGLGQLVRIDISGGNPFVFTKSSGPDNPDISPDSKWLIYSAWTDGRERIFRTLLDGSGEPEMLTDYSSTEPRYSPDGRGFACFIRDESTNQFNKLAIVGADGGEPLKTFTVPPNTNSSRGPVWTPDGKGITLIVSPGELQNLWVQPADGGDAKQLTKFELPGVARRDYSRDGKQIALMRGEGFGNVIMITDFR